MPQVALEIAQPILERKKYRRVRLTTQVQCAAPGRKDTLVTRDISLGGLLIVTKAPYPANSEIDLSFSLPPAGPHISCRGQVGHTIEGCGRGVRFLELSEGFHLALKNIVDETD